MFITREQLDEVGRLHDVSPSNLEVAEEQGYLKVLSSLHQVWGMIEANICNNVDWAARGGESLRSLLNFSEKMRDNMRCYFIISVVSSNPARREQQEEVEAAAKVKVPAAILTGVEFAGLSMAQLSEVIQKFRTKPVFSFDHKKDVVQVSWM